MIEIFHFSSIFYHCSVYRASCCEAQGFFYFVTVIWLPEGHYWATYRGKPYSPDVSHSVANAFWPKIPGNLKTIFGPRRVWTCNFRISDFECNTTTAMLPQRPLHCNAMAPQRLLHCIAMVTLAPLGSRKPMFEGLASLSLSLCLSLSISISLSLAWSTTSSSVMRQKGYQNGYFKKTEHAKFSEKQTLIPWGVRIRCSTLSLKFHWIPIIWF